MLIDGILSDGLAILSGDSTIGYMDTGYRIDGGDTVFWLMSTNENFKIEHYMKLMHDYSYGEYTPPVYKAEE